MSEVSHKRAIPPLLRFEDLQLYELTRSIMIIKEKKGYIQRGEIQVCQEGGYFIVAPQSRVQR